MPQVAADNPIVFKPLYTSPLVSVSDYNCGLTAGGPAAEEESLSDTIVLMRHGAFCKHIEGEAATANVNQAAFFAKRSTYRVSHPTDCGDRGTVFEIGPRVLREIMRELDPEVDARPDHQLFPFYSGPCASDVFWRHRELVQKLESGQPLEHLWADVTALQIAADVLGAAYTRKETGSKRRRTTTADHAARTEAAKTYLAANIGEAVTLEDVAAAVNSSPFNFARIFQEQTGLPVHRYLTLLRLRVALERLADGADDITELALDMGFSSHSHFTDVFRREFGSTPSTIRQKK